MNLRAIGIVFRKELVDVLRDRRTLISMIVVPVLVTPALILGVGLIAAKAVSQARHEVPRVMVWGGEDSPRLLVALKALTVWAAEQYFEERSKGTLEVGKLADFTVLSENPLAIDRSRLRELVVLETIKEGESVYRR